MSEETRKIEYHYGFYGAIRLRYEHGDDKGLELHQELELGAKPLRLDMLLVDDRDVRRAFPDEIAQIFRGHDILEYKSPKDALSIDDFFKALAYAFLYKSMGKTVDEIPLEELSVSIFRHTFPRKMFSALERSGFRVRKAHPGIYRVEGAIVPVQVAVISQLPAGYEELKILARDARKEDVAKVLEDMYRRRSPGEIEHIGAVLRVSMAANPGLYEEIREEGMMVDVFERIFSKEIAAKRAEGVAEGRAEGRIEGHAEGRIEGHAEGRLEGRAEGGLNMLFALVDDGLIPLDTASAKAGMGADEFKARMEGWSKEALSTP